jgi:polysaccharide export outer membrane protein
MFNRAIILIAIGFLILTIGCSKKVVKSEGVIGGEVSVSQEKGDDKTSSKDIAKSAEIKNEDKDIKKAGESKTTSIDEYVIGSEDVLEIMVWRNEILSRPRIVVRPDGKISLPLVGDIHTAGLTAKQVKEDIEKRLKEYEELPNVTVIVAEINSYYIYILGEVTRPGRYQLKSNISVLQAVSLAGGFTNWASPNSMVVLRRNGEKEEKIKVRYKKIISGSRPEDNIVLKPGDTIIIP